jgi:uncharacterized protein YkwD
LRKGERGDIVKTLTRFYGKEVLIPQLPGRKTSNNILHNGLHNNSINAVLLMLLVLMIPLQPVLYQQNNNLAYLLSTGWEFSQTMINNIRHNIVPRGNTQYTIPTNNGLYLLPTNEQAVLELVNEARKKEHLQPYILDEELTAFARIKGEDMLLNNYIEHNSPTLGRPGELAAKKGYKFQIYGENLAGTLQGNSLPPDLAFHHLMQSEHHRGAILSAKNTHIGVGVVKGKEKGVVYVMHFALQ